MLFSSRKLFTAGLALLLVAAFAGEAFAAREASAQGFYRHSRGRVNIPLQLKAPATVHNQMTVMAPNQVPMFSGPVTLSGMGAGGGKIILPMSIQKEAFMGFVPLTSPNIQIYTMFSMLTAPVVGGTFSTGNGPGSFTFCPGPFNIATPGLMAAGCPALTAMWGTGGMTAFLAARTPRKTDPLMRDYGMGSEGFTMIRPHSQTMAPAWPIAGRVAPQAGTFPTTRNGRVVYIAGPNVFGGVSRHILAGGGLVVRYREGFSFAMNPGVVQAFKEPFGGGGAATQVNGGTTIMTALMPNGTLGSTNMLSGSVGGFYSQPRVAPAAMSATSIMASQYGPRILSVSTTTMAGMTYTMTAKTSCPTTGGGTMGGTAGMAFPNIPLTGANACVSGNTSTLPLLLPPAGTTINTGFPFTTGTVFAQQTTNTGPGTDVFTVSGSNNRTERGKGNITLVSGGLSIRRTNVGADRSTGSIEQITMTIGNKVPAISPGGLAAAAVLMVLAVGYGMRRRF